MFVWSALDESSDRLQRDVYVVAGLLATSEDWFETERLWNRYLSSKGLNHFRTSEYRGLKGEFAKYRDEAVYPKPRGREAAKEILDDLAQIVRTSPVVGIVLGMNLRGYRELRRGARARHLFPMNPYRHLYQTMLVRIAAFMGDLPSPQIVAFLCDEHSRGAQLANSYSELKRLNPISAQYMGSLSFQHDENSAAIQAADLVAALCKDYYVKQVKGKATEDDLEALTANIGMHIGLGYIDKPLLKKLIQANYLKNGRPSIRSSLQQKLFNDLFRIPHRL